MLTSNRCRLMRYRNAFVVFLTCITGVLAQSDPSKADLAPELHSALDGISAASLRDDLTYIASDELAGRDTPSPGLDLAADYIAAEFKKAGLEPGVGESYFQDASMLVDSGMATVDLKLSAGGREFTAARNLPVSRLQAELDLKDAPVLKLDLADEALVRHLSSSQVEGKVVITEYNPRFLPRLGSVNGILRSGAAKLVILVDKKGLTTRDQRRRQLVDPTQASTAATTPRVTVTGEDAARFYDGLRTDARNATASVHIAGPHRTPVRLRNVLGVLRGSDPALRDTYVLLTAHYDHLGIRAEGFGDHVYNGANDDGSGTVSVMEVARALARLPKHPRRSIVFMTFFGEEEGLIGSTYYAHHPVWPLAKTVADLNLEQVGRTDSSEGPQISNASLTGFDYSDLTSYVQRAGERTGIKVYKNAKGSDPYFSQSDNFSLAEAGVPAETLCVAFEFPDYHAVGDESQKIDYNNMAKVDRAIALAMFLMADSEQPVRWNDANPKAAPYIKAGKQLREE
jgi:peptidase M28-like protein